jgi:hypothetical protein
MSQHVSGRALSVTYLCCRIWLYGIKRAAVGGAGVAGSVGSLACPAGPIPLAARGLAAVLARAGPAGGGSCQAAVHRWLMRVLPATSP